MTKGTQLFSCASWDNSSFIMPNIYKLITFLNAKTGLTGPAAAVQILLQVILL